MEYWVTIAIPNVEEALAEAIFEALIHEDAESGAVRDIELASGRTTFVLGIEGDEPLGGSSVGGELFGEPLAGAGTHRSGRVKIIDVHAEFAPADELPRSELKTA